MIGHRQCRGQMKYVWRSRAVRRTYGWYQGGVCFTLRAPRPRTRGYQHFKSPYKEGMEILHMNEQNKISIAGNELLEMG